MNLGIPYMGSKRKLASEILRIIIPRHPGITDFYDIFGGGGSISFIALKNYRFNVHYNELSKGICALVKYLRDNKELEPKFFEWVTRETFFKEINRTDGDWFTGFVMSCWSFGNKQSSYLYGADIEEIKRLAHEFIVNGCLESMRCLKLDISELLNIKDIQKRRTVFCLHIENITKNRFNLQNLQPLSLLEHLARMQNLQNLQITNLSYESVPITGNNPVLYCDIPYKGTGEYKEKSFNHEAFYEWASGTPHPVYISEYSAPFEEIYAFTHRSSLSATNNKKKTIEKLFWNGKGSPTQTTLFENKLSEMPKSDKHEQVLILTFKDGSQFIRARADLKPLHEEFNNWMWL